MDTSTRSSKKKYYVTEHYFLMFFACRMTSLVLLVMVMLISFHPILIWTTRSDLRTILMLLFIRAQLDEDLDVRTFRIGNYGFSDFVRNITMNQAIIQVF